MEISIVGAGPSGLTTACLLLQSGFVTSLTVYDYGYRRAAKGAGAFWESTREPDVIARRRETISFAHFTQLAKISDSGISARRALELRTDNLSDEDINWQVPGHRLASADELSAYGSQFVAGIWFDTFAIDTGKYLNYLRKQARLLGGKIIRKRITNIDDLLTKSDVVVACAGLGCRELRNDSTLRPARGQTVDVPLHLAGRDAQLGVIPYIYAAHSWCVPHGQHARCGGTKELGDSNEDPKVRKEEVEKVLTRLGTWLPGFAATAKDAISTQVGLRPMRDEPKVAITSCGSGKFVVDNYGHSGSGFSFSFGCAAEVVDLIQRVR